MTESNIELARRGWEAALRGDLETLSELLYPNADDALAAAGR